MKIYQIHEYGGSYEDKYDYLRFTYLDKYKAIIKKEKLEAEEETARMCDNCPLHMCPANCDLDCSKCTEEDGILRAKSFCERCDIEKVENKNSSSGYYIYCKNKSNHYDDSYFEIIEVEVIE